MSTWIKVDKLSGGGGFSVDPNATPGGSSYLYAYQPSTPVFENDSDKHLVYSTDSNTTGDSEVLTQSLNSLTKLNAVNDGETKIVPDLINSVEQFDSQDYTSVLTFNDTLVGANTTGLYNVSDGTLLYDYSSLTPDDVHLLVYNNNLIIWGFNNVYLHTTDNQQFKTENLPFENSGVNLGFTIFESNLVCCEQYGLGFIIHYTSDLSNWNNQVLAFSQPTSESILFSSSKLGVLFNSRGVPTMLYLNSLSEESLLMFVSSITNYKSIITIEGKDYIIGQNTNISTEEVNLYEIDYDNSQISNVFLLTDSPDMWVNSPIPLNNGLFFLETIAQDVYLSIIKLKKWDVATNSLCDVQVFYVMDYIVINSVINTDATTIYCDNCCFYMNAEFTRVPVKDIIL